MLCGPNRKSDMMTDIKLLQKTIKFRENIAIHKFKLYLMLLLIYLILMLHDHFRITRIV